MVESFCLEFDSSGGRNVCKHHCQRALVEGSALVSVDDFVERWVCLQNLGFVLVFCVVVDYVESVLSAFCSVEYGSCEDFSYFCEVFKAFSFYCCFVSGLWALCFDYLRNSKCYGY